MNIRLVIISMYILKKNLKEGMILSEDIINPNGGPALMRAGQVLNEKKIALLDRVDVSGFEVSLSKDDPLSEYEGKPFFNQNVNPTISRESFKRVNGTISNVYSKSVIGRDNIEEIVKHSKEIADRILNIQTLDYNLGDYAKENIPGNDLERVSLHSTRVAIFATAVAKEYASIHNLNINLPNVATAAMLHDFDFLCRNESYFKGIVYSKTRDAVIAKQCSKDSIFSVLNSSETSKETSNYISNLKSIRRQYFIEQIEQLKNVYKPKYGPYYTFNKLQDGNILEVDDVNASVKNAILLSREDQDENGPLKIKQSVMMSKTPSIITAQIINLCSVYDEELEKCLENETSLENAYAAISNLKINREILDAFTEVIPLYPIGNYVQLSDGRTARVYENFSGTISYYKPIVELESGELVDLRKEYTTTIEKVHGYEIGYDDLISKKDSASKRR